MIILDTDIISILDARSGEEYQRLLNRLSSADVERVCITIISVEEQMRGWLSYISASRTLGREVEEYVRPHRMLDWHAKQEVLDFDNTAADQFASLKKSRIKCGSMDLKIASIALAHDALLVSRNLRDFRAISSLRVEDWTC